MSRLQKWNELKALCQAHNIDTKGKYGTTEDITSEVYRIQSYETLYTLCETNQLETELNEYSPIESIESDIKKINKYCELLKLNQEEGNHTEINFAEQTVEDLEFEISYITLRKDSYSYLNLSNKKASSDNECVYAVCENIFKNGKHTEITLNQLVSMVNSNFEGIDMAYNEEQLNGSCLKPYFDFDYEHKSEQEAKDNEKTDRVNAIATIMTFYNATKQILNSRQKGYEDIWVDRENENKGSSYPIDPNQSFNINMVAFSSSCGRKKTDANAPEIWKNSFHYNLVCGIVMKNGAVMKKIINSPEFAEEQKSINSKGFKVEKPDMAVYVGEGKYHPFRMPFGSKIGSTRRMIPQKLVGREWQPYDNKTFTVSDMRKFMVSIGDFDQCRIYANSEYLKSESTEYDENEVVALFQKAYPEEAKCHSNYHTAGDKIRMNRHTGSDCPLCADGNRKNETDTQWHGNDSNAYIWITKENKFLYFCRYSKKPVCLNPITEIYKGHETESEPITPAPEDKRKKTAEGRLSILVEHINKKTDSIIAKKKAQLTTNTLRTTAKYVSEIPELINSIMNKEADIIAVSANMGEGKTRMIAQCMNDLKQLSLLNGFDDRILMSVMRISLAKKFSTDFPAFTNYLDQKENKISDPFTICQLDSLNRIEWPNKTGYSCRCVVLDEIDQQRKHLMSATYTSNPKVVENLEKLKYIIRNAEQVIIMSANISQTDIDWIKSMRAERTYTTIEISETGERKILTTTDTKSNSVKTFINESPDMLKNEIHLTTQPDRVKALILRDLIAGKKVYLAHNYSTAYANEISKLYNGTETTEHTEHFNKIKGLSILNINADTLNNSDVISALENPNEEWGKYQLVVASPSVQSGVSYDIPDVFDSIYGYFINSASESGDACQALRRIRHPKNNTINVYIKTMGSNAITSKTELRNAIINNRKVPFNESIKLMDYHYNQYGIKELTENQYLDWYLTIASERNWDKANYTYNFIRHQIEYGNTISTIEEEYQPDSKEEANEMIEMRAETKIVAKVARKERKEEWLANIIETPLATEEEYNAIKKKIIPLNTAEKLICEKYRIHRTYTLNPMVPHSDIDYGILSNPNTIKQYKNCEIYHNKTIEQGLALIRESEISRELYNRHHGETEISTTKLLIQSLSLKYNYDRHKVISEWMEKFGIKSYSANDIFVANGKPRKYEKKEFDSIVEYITKTHLLTNRSTELGIQKSNVLTFRQALFKINAIVESEFAFKFVKIDKHNEVYIIQPKGFRIFNKNIFTNIDKPRELYFTKQLVDTELSKHIQCIDIANIVSAYAL